MTKTPVRAADTGLPNSRRAILRSILAAGAVAATALPATVANAAEGADSEILALEAETRRLDGATEEIQTRRVEPFDDAWHALVLTDLTAARAFSRESGREKAVVEIQEIDLKGARLFDRMVSLPARTQAGKAAKVRTFLWYVAGCDWRGPSSALDWEIEAARKLLGEFAGMSEEELANV